MQINEDLIGYLWQFQYFDKEELRTDEGQALSVLRQGLLNSNAGPDFEGVHIQLDEVLWVGDVELHVRSSDWTKHEHQTDRSYESVVLHVVWENDTPIRRKDGTFLPTLSLRGRVSQAILSRYEYLKSQPTTIACASVFKEVDSLVKLRMLDRVLLERLSQKAERVVHLWKATQCDWEETAYQWLAHYWGGVLNGPPMARLAKTIPLKLLQKHRDNLLQIEALLFGAGGWLSDLASNDPYCGALVREFRFLSAKYQLAEDTIQPHEWKFLRLRPAGFPTVRLAQWAVFCQSLPSFFSTFIETERPEDLQALLGVQQSAYWQKHYRFGKEAGSKVPRLGLSTANTLIINGAVPLLFAYGKERGIPELVDKAVGWLEALPAEANAITREWASLDMQVKTAFDSQALIEWQKAYCGPKRCLSCTVGASLLKPSLP
jgi:hypothetical protein